MNTEGQHLEEIAVTGTSDPEWFSTLVSETVEFERTGTCAAVLSFRLHEAHEVERRSQQMATLLRRLLRPTDRFAQTSEDSFSVLLAPLASITDASSHIHALNEALGNAGLMVSTGFAHRREGESLLDTWARAEAQSDRAAFRLEHRQGIQLSE